MPESANDDDMATGARRTLEFAAMRHNIAECVTLVDEQTFGRPAK